MSRVDGRDLVTVVPSARAGGHHILGPQLISNDVVLFLEVMEDGTRELRRVKIGGPPSTILDHVHLFAVSRAERVVYAARIRSNAGRGSVDDGVVKLPFNGAAAELVLPASHSSGFRMRQDVVVSPDGLSVASGFCDEPLQVRFGGDEVMTPFGGGAVGFDAGGRLVFAEGCHKGRVFRWATGMREPEPLSPPVAAVRSWVSPSGEWLAYLQEEPSTTLLTITNLVDGHLRQISLGRGAWDFSATSLEYSSELTDRFAVLYRIVEGDSIAYAVQDLIDGTTRYFPLSDSLPE